MISKLNVIFTLYSSWENEAYYLSYKLKDSLNLMIVKLFRFIIIMLCDALLYEGFL